MEKYKKITEYSFSEHKFPVISLAGCKTVEYNPSQTDKIYSENEYVFIIVSGGRGIITYSDKRYAITSGSGFIVNNGTTVHLKADSIEPLGIIEIHIKGDNAKDIFSLIEKKENGIILKLQNDSKIRDCAQDLVVECSKSYVTDYGIMLAFYEFINSIDEHYIEKKIPTKNSYMTRAVEYIKQNYNKNISVENIANLLGIERSYLSRLFKTYKNKSTQNYIIDYRMRQAKRMFEEEDMNVSQVCSAVGYTNIYCFSRIFKSRVGMPPKEYMERCRKKVR